MNIYRISAMQGQVSFRKTIKADTYEEARKKFNIEINKNNMSFPYIQPELDIVNINKRY